MASGVFGLPISEETLKATGEYKGPITQKDVADYAKKMINSADKDTNAQKFVDYLKQSYGNGITTKCLIYNATGTTLNFADYKDWQGHIFETPFPAEIQNGQWGAFLHVHPTAQALGSTGAVVYRSKIPDGSDSCNWLFCWSIPYIGDNNVYTEINEEGYFPQHWDSIYDTKLAEGRAYIFKHTNGYRSDTNIGEGTTINARAVFEFPQ